MCIGLPMQVVEVREHEALCSYQGSKRTINTQLVGDVVVGSWLLVFIDSAREVIDEDTALRNLNAITALEKVMDSGGAADDAALFTIDTLFADLIDRPTPKPASLIALEAAQRAKEK